MVKFTPLVTFAAAPKIPTAGEPAPSFARLRNRDDAFLTIDLHGRLQCSRAAAEVLKKSVRISTPHESGLEQLRIIGSGVPLWLSLADDWQHLHLLHGLGPERNPSQVAVIQARTVVPSQHVARSVEDDFAAIDFDAR
jgi:hypothetical protein